MTHRGPFQPLPFCDSVILEENERSIQIKINIKKLYGNIVPVSEHACTDPAGVVFCGNDLHWEYGTNFCRAARRGCVGREGAYSSLAQYTVACNVASGIRLCTVCKASGLRLVALQISLSRPVLSHFLCLDLL